MPYCKCKGTGLIRDKRSYMGVRICTTHQIKEEPEPEEEWEFDDDWEIDEFDDP